MSQEPHPRTDETTTGSVPGDGPEEQAAMAAADDDEDRGGVPPQGSVPDDLAEAGEEQLKEGMEPGGRVAGDGGTPGAADRS